MSKKKKYKKIISSNGEVWTEEQYEEYLQQLYGMDFIAGFTEGGVPYGIFEDEAEAEGNCKIGNTNNTNNTDLSF